MKLTTITQVTVDGVMQGNGGASDEDRRNGFERGGWAMGVFDDETMTFINQTYQHADAFLFGRRTYELFAGYWGAEERARAAAEDPGNHQIAAALNTKPKYLASTTLTDPRWANTTVLSGDLAAAIRELKAKPGGDLQVHGSGALIRWLLDNDLVDEFTREALVMHAVRSIGADELVAQLDALVARRGRAPRFLRSDNGTELTSHAFRDWCRFSTTESAFIEPGAPWQNPFVESFHARVRDELLNIEQFVCLAEARVVIGDWHEDYNRRRPHSALGMRTPAAFAAEWAAQAA